jgi:hypothetical protein
MRNGARYPKHHRNKEISTTMDNISSMTPEAMRDLLQSVGFRAEIVPGATSGSLIRSATNGVSFEVRLFNKLPGPVETYADLLFTAGLQIQGVLNAEIVNRWNMTKRFGRLYVVPGMLVLTMDVLLQEATSNAHLRAQLGLWDRLMQELLIYLRTSVAEPGVQAADAPRPGRAPLRAAAEEAAPDAGEDRNKPVAANGEAHATAAELPKPASLKSVSDQAAVSAAQ